MMSGAPRSGSLYWLTSVPQTPATSTFSSAASGGISGRSNSRSSVVDAPGATLPLIPGAAHTWGRFWAALLTTAGWTTGSLIAFLIARRWGAPVVRRLTSMERVKRLKAYIPDNLFWSIVVLRTVLPMDVISYVLGLFTDMSWASYAA